MSKQQLLFLCLFASTAITLAVLAIIKMQAPMKAASVSALFAFSSAAGLILWWNSKHKSDVRNERDAGKSGRSLMWLLALFSVSAVVALIQAMHEKWNVGDTIGLCFFLIFACSSIYEAFRRKRTKDLR